MMRLTLTRLGAPALAALILAACSGGGGGTSVPHSTPQTSPSTTPTSAPGVTGSQARLVVKIPRSTKNILGTAAAAKRSPRYLSLAAEGLQVAVSAGTTSKTLYYDISSNNTTACTTSTAESILGTYLESCTVTLPWLAATETVSVVETDETPTDENPTTDQGDGFPSGTNILGIGSTQATLTPGTLTSVSLGISPIVDGLVDTTQGVQEIFGGYFPGLTAIALSTPTFAVDDDSAVSRVVVTSGERVQGIVATTFEDADNAPVDEDTTALPFMNLSATPAPLTVTSSATAVTVDPYVNTGFSNTFSALPQATATTPPSVPAGYAQNTTIANDGYEWEGFFFLTGVYYDGSSSSSSTVTFSTAASAAAATATLAGDSTPIGPYTASVAYTVVPVSASALPTSTSLASGASVTVTGNDPGASNPMSADYACAGSGAGSVSAGTSANTYVVTPLAAGTCTLHLYDGDTGVSSNPVTITIAGYNTPSGFTASPSSVAFDLVTNDSPQQLTISDSDGSLLAAASTINCLADPASGNAVATIGGYSASSGSSATLTVSPGTATGACNVLITDGSGNKLGVTVTVTENAIGVFAKHRKTK